MVFNLPNLEPKLTKEYLLSKNSEETYMRTYLGVSITKKLIVSPLRNDKRPTASFYRNKKNKTPAGSMPAASSASSPSLKHILQTYFLQQLISKLMYLL